MGDWTPREQRFSELPARLASALVLIPLALGAVWHGGWWLALACATFAAVMMWEWVGMSGLGPRLPLATAGAIFGLVLGFEEPALSSAVCFGISAAAAMLCRHTWRRALMAAGGPIYVLGMVAGLFILREGPWDGRAAALYFMSFVWASDAAAYFGGRAIGGPRLLPRESPNKTWAGGASALLACAICGYFAAGIEGVDRIAWILAGIIISIVAQFGDLFESGLKRRFNVKDSGTILPGHGGLLDRVDGLGAVSVAGSLLMLLWPAIPALLGLV